MMPLFDAIYGTNTISLWQILLRTHFIFTLPKIILKEFFLHWLLKGVHDVDSDIATSVGEACLKFLTISFIFLIETSDFTFQSSSSKSAMASVALNPIVVSHPSNSTQKFVFTVENGDVQISEWHRLWIGFLRYAFSGSLRERSSNQRELNFCLINTWRLSGFNNLDKVLVSIHPGPFQMEEN